MEVTAMTKVPRRVLGRSVRLQKEERAFVGIDVHKLTYHVAVWAKGRDQLVASWVQPAEAWSLSAKLERLKGRIDWVVYEAGPTGFGLVRALRQAGLKADVIAPGKTPSARTQEAKSDRLDCGRLAEYAAKKLLSIVGVPTESQEGHRQIVRLRSQMKRKCHRTKVQIKMFLLMHGVKEPRGLKDWSGVARTALKKIALPEDLRFTLDILVADLEQTEKLLREATRRVEQLASSPEHQEVVTLLQTAPGVGVLTAMTVRTELFEPTRFTDGREVASLMGLAPLVRSSGMTRREGGVMKCGNMHLKCVLVEAAWRWVAQDEAARKRFGHLRHNTGSVQKAIVAMARRLGIILWRMSQRMEPYRAAA
jgi:transposase